MEDDMTTPGTRRPRASSSEPTSDTVPNTTPRQSGTIGDEGGSAGTRGSIGETYGTGAQTIGAQQTSASGYGAQGTERGNGDNAEGWSGAIRQFATSSLNSQKHRARESLDEIARTIRESAEPLTNSGRTTAASYVRTAADRLETLATRIDERSFNDLVHDMQGFARRQPMLFVGAAFGAGLLGARFFKSSADRSSLRSVGGERTEAAGVRRQTPPSYGGEIPSGSTI